MEDIKLGSILKHLRSKKGLSLREISEKTGLSKASLSNIENNINNPTTNNLSKICDALGYSIEYLLNLKKNLEKYEPSTSDNDFAAALDSLLEIMDDTEIKKSEDITFTNELDAMKFILNQPSIMGFGGFKINKLSDKEVIDFANELLNQLKLLGYKYKR